MKIAFWSGTDVEGGATEKMAVFSMVLKYVFGLEVILSCNYVSDFMPEHCFWNTSSQHVHCQKTYQYYYGETAYFRRLWETDYTSEKHIKTLLGEITIIPPPAVKESAVFYYNVPGNIMYLMDVAPQTSGNVLEEADVVVVFLSQSRVKIHKFFEQYASIIPKALFLINDFRKDGDYISRILSTKYQIRKECIGVFPYCKGYHMAREERKVEEFLISNLRCCTQNPNYYFIQNLLLTAKSLVEKQEAILEGKEIEIDETIA